MGAMRTRQTLDATAVALMVVATALIACKKTEDAAAKQNPTTGSSPSINAAGAGRSRPAPAARPLFDSNLDNVCNGMPEKRAKKYAKQPGEIHPLVLFSRTSESDSWTKSYSDKLDGWKTTEASDYQLVGCVTAKQVKKVKECKFDAKTPVRYLDLADVTYELTIYAAETGEKLATKSVEVKAPTRCPMIHMFREQRETDLPDFAPAFIEFAKPFVAPK